MSCVPLSECLGLSDLKICGFQVCTYSGDGVVHLAPIGHRNSLMVWLLLTPSHTLRKKKKKRGTTQFMPDALYIGCPVEFEGLKIKAH